MQDLIVGDVYIATLNNHYYKNEQSVLKYIGPHDEWAGVDQFEVMELKQWPEPLIDDDPMPEEDNVWRKGTIIDLGVGGYTFEPYNIVLENE